MICFYHRSDFDGMCSGAIVKMVYPKCSFRGLDYGDYFPWDEVKNRDVVMVDFSLPIDDMLRLRKEAQNFIWIDHHIGIIQEAQGHEFDGVLNSDRAACESTWLYFCPDKPIPEVVRLIGRYDVWDHSDPKTLPFQYGLKLYMTHPVAYQDLWQQWFDEFPQEILEEGKIVLRYVERDNDHYVDSCSFKTDLDGFRCIAVNKMLTNSQLFDSVWNEDKYDIMLTFGFKGSFWVVSLYTTKDDIDVLGIAKAHGGGGHKQAAGFTCKELPFLIENK